MLRNKSMNTQKNQIKNHQQKKRYLVGRYQKVFCGAAISLFIVRFVNYESMKRQEYVLFRGEKYSKLKKYFFAKREKKNSCYVRYI